MPAIKATGLVDMVAFCDTASERAERAAQDLAQVLNEIYCQGPGALVVTQILVAIYESAKTGQSVYFS